MDDPPGITRAGVLYLVAAMERVNERVSVLRVPGDRPATVQSRDGGGAHPLNPRDDHPNPVSERVPLGRLQGRPPGADGALLRRPCLLCQLGVTPLHVAPAARTARRG